MREIGEYLVDIHGQSEHLSLLRVRQHLDLLDRYSDIESILTPYQITYKHLLDIRKELNMLRQAERDAARRTDLLTYQINEIEAANLKPGEDDDLKEEHNRLANAEELNSLIVDTLILLDENSPDNPTISDLMGSVVSSLESLGQIDPSRLTLSITASQIFEDITELNSQLRDYQEQIEFNPNRLKSG